MGSFAHLEITLLVEQHLGKWALSEPELVTLA